MTKLTRKLNVNMLYMWNNSLYIWNNILGKPSKKRWNRIYFDRKVNMITNVGIPSKDRYSLRKRLVDNIQSFDLGKAIKWLPELFRVSIKQGNKNTTSQRNNSVVLQHNVEVRYKVEPKRNIQ